MLARMFERIPLPPSWPVYVSHEEAAAFARWRGRRLPTEAEFHRAAFGTPPGTSARIPWGDAPPTRARGNFDFESWDPVPAGAHPPARAPGACTIWSATAGSGRRTVFAPFPGFEPMPSYPEYSADFFDGEHYVMKGASPATARELIRRASATGSGRTIRTSTRSSATAR